MSTTINKTLSLKSFFNDRAGWQRTLTLDSLKAHIAKSNPYRVPFVVLWGAGEKQAATNVDKDGILYLFHFLKRAEDAFNVKCHLSVIFVDTHAYLNGYATHNYMRYFEDIDYHIRKHNYSSVLGSRLCHAAVEAEHFKNTISYIDHLMVGADDTNLLDVPEEIIKPVIDKFAGYALKYCRRIANYSSNLGFQDEFEAAKAYLKWSFFEKKVIEEHFPDAALITYMSRDESVALADLPRIHLYTIKGGQRTRPWFIYENLICAE